MAFIIEAVLVLIVLYLLCRVSYSKYQIWRRLPPGPIGIPILGYLPFLGAKPHETLAKMRKKYGDIIGLKFGMDYVVILNEYNLFKEGLSHQATFNRPSKLFGDVKLGFASSSGDVWREQRKFVANAMKTLGIGRGTWETINKESSKCLIDELKSYGGRPVYITEELQGILANNIMALLYGKRFDPETEKDKIQLLARFSILGLKYYGPSAPSSFLPGFFKLCEFLGIEDYRKSTEYSNKFYEIAAKEIEDHTLLKNYPGSEDFISLYKEKQKQMNDANKQHTFTDNHMFGSATALFLGSSDTVTSSIEILLLLMAEHLHVQKKVHDELDEVVGRDGSITYDERFKTPYTFAVLLEAQRYFSIVPMTATRRLSEDIELGGYLIPKGSLLAGNVWAVHNDPQNWKNPHLFQPERFLTEDKQLVLNPKNFVAFSIGNRNCVGTTVAWMVILSMFTAVMQNFEISIPPGIEVNSGTTSGVVVHMAPQLLCFKERK